MGMWEPYQYYDIPAAPKRMFSKAHCDEMVKQCEANAETWMELYNRGTRPDGAYVANYFKKLADMWRKMDAKTMTNHPNLVELM